MLSIRRGSRRKREAALRRTLDWPLARLNITKLKSIPAMLETVALDLKKIADGRQSLTESLCPLSVAVQAPVAVSHSLTVQSRDADASIFESWENATELTKSRCPSSVCTHASQFESTFGGRASQAGN